MLGLTGIPAVIELLLLPFFPESPRYLLIQKGDETSSKKGEHLQKVVCVAAERLGYRGVPCNLSPSALQRLRGWDDVDAEMTEMRLEDQSERAEGHLTVLSLLSQRSLRWQLVSVVIMNMGQQLSGVNAVRQTDTNTEVLILKTILY